MATDKNSGFSDSYRRYSAWAEQKSPLWYCALIYGIGVAVAAFISLNRETLLPPNFENDTKTIFRFVNGVENTPGSYKTTAEIYMALHLQDHSELAGLFGILLASVCMGIALWRCGGLPKGVVAPSLVIGYFVLAGAFLGTYTKEVVILAALIVILLLPSKIYWDALAFLILLGVGTFRPYWFLLSFGFLTLRGALLFKRRVPLFLAGQIGLCIAFSLAIFYVLGYPSDHFRSTVNEIRNPGDDDATTMITRVVDVSSEPLGGLLNNLITVVSFLFPWPLFRLGDLYHVVCGLLFMFLWAIVFWSLWKTRNQNISFASRYVSILGGFLVVQGLYEPDYGSALRHLTPLIPLILASFCITRGDHVEEADKSQNEQFEITNEKSGRDKIESRELHDEGELKASNEFS